MLPTLYPIKIVPATTAFFVDPAVLADATDNSRTYGAPNAATR